MHGKVWDGSKFLDMWHFTIIWNNEPDVACDSLTFYKFETAKQLTHTEPSGISQSWLPVGISPLECFLKVSMPETQRRPNLNIGLYLADE